MYNNETGLFDDVGWCEIAEWWEDEDRNLYIIPPAVDTDDIEGPDGTPAYNLLMDWCRSHPNVLPTPWNAPELESAGLSYIWSTFRRFYPKNGYYRT